MDDMQKYATKIAVNKDLTRGTISNAKPIKIPRSSLSLKMSAMGQNGKTASQFDGVKDPLKYRINIRR